MDACVLINPPGHGESWFPTGEENSCYYKELINKHVIRKGSEEILRMALIEIYDIWSLQKVVLFLRP